MIKDFKITVVVDNSTLGKLLGEHGLSFYIEADDKRILIDSGKGEAFEKNIKMLNIDLAQLDYFLLSHGHYDHTNGIAFVLEHSSDKLKTFIDSEGLKPKFSVTEDSARNIGMSKYNIAELKKLDDKLIFTDDFTEISKDIYVTGRVPRIYDAEKSQTHFFIDESGREEDVLNDDQSFFFNTSKGVVVILGCCHSGLGNTLDYIAKLASVDEFYCVIGGMHLRNASQAKLVLAVESLIKYNVQLVAPCHCTGQKESAFIYSKLPDAFSECFAGKVFSH